MVVHNYDIWGPFPNNCLQTFKISWISRQNITKDRLIKSGLNLRKNVYIL